jgi:hypothetical protein
MKSIKSILRKSSTSRTPSNIPDLPEAINDNFYLASASKAAEMDIASGAYDEFLFSEDGMAKMPYEQAVEDHLALVEMRLVDSGRRSVLVEKLKLLDAESAVVKYLRREDSLKDELIDRDEKLDKQAQILEGEKSGRANLFWPGAMPVQTSLLNGWMRISARYLVFILVAAVDIGLIFAAFNAILANTNESILLTLPAVGVQIAFPHFVGNRIAMLLRKPAKVLVYWIEIVVMFSIWVTFAIVLTDLRVLFITTGQETNTVLQDSKLALFFSLLFMLLGLGLWLMVNEIRHNPHETKYARLLFSKHRVLRELEKNRMKISQSSALIPALEASLQVAEKSFEDSVQAARAELADAAKSVYRRSLVNQLGEVDFTSAYIGKTSKSSPGREARRAKDDMAAMDKEWRKTPRQRSVDKDEVSSAKTSVVTASENQRAEKPSL